MGDPIDETLAGVLARLEGQIASDDEVAIWESRRAADLRHDLIRQSGVLEVLSQKGADAIVGDRCLPTRALDLVRQWVASSHPVLCLFGSVGAGKTVAAGWALSRMPGRYVRADELTVMRKADYGRASDDYARHLRGELLVVDELGIEERADLATETLLAVLDRRQRLPRRTLLLGNLDAQHLAKRYDERVLSRLRESAIVRSVRCADMRGAA